MAWVLYNWSLSVAAAALPILQREPKQNSNLHRCAPIIITAVYVLRLHRRIGQAKRQWQNVTLLMPRC
jgi:hypothetical protein